MTSKSFLVRAGASQQTDRYSGLFAALEVANEAQAMDRTATLNLKESQ
jgi:hypothetical protein